MYTLYSANSNKEPRVETQGEPLKIKSMNRVYTSDEAVLYKLISSGFHVLWHSQ
jgi:hypothetical protein